MSTPEPPQIRDIRRLKPPLAQSVMIILEWLKIEGFRPFITETYRSPERAKWLVEHGRGAILKSRHCQGEAVDFGFKDEHGNAIWDGNYHGWKRLAEMAKMRGLTSGYYWKKKDCPHVEMK